ncbi:RsmB/NOP family class I SAM-dependent RNA methyltransferase [Seohaeicola saemankumensis]|nr:RsmB/NOP family class I SAM-dependent RNA methyltransferase [Seohaeicola saemankumensis]MCA0873727.1 RsmB/NOP family class I SAM-dependent RNA methyltransferase [Seohaeicola saemankumensis]
MTPAARAQAAIEVLDTIAKGRPAEQALTGWARRSRFAGSKDRAAVRDLVFDAIRCRRSLAALGGGNDGRALILGLCRRDGIDPDTLFTGQGYGPEPLSQQERDTGGPPIEPAEALDIPDWLWPRFSAALGAQAKASAEIMQGRAPVHLRVNRKMTDRDTAIKTLAADGIGARIHPAAGTALEIIENPRKLRNSAAYLNGMVELQDAASQAVVEALPLVDGQRVLDYCAGGGGKSLALAARANIDAYAHDIAAERMRDLPARAARSGVQVTRLEPGEPASLPPFDLVLCDAPCSGSGAWRRAPEGKWTLTPDRLTELTGIQLSILTEAADLVAPGGLLAYATCSFLPEENSNLIERFIQQSSNQWAWVWQQSWPLSGGTDGFFSVHLTRVE